MYDDLWTQICRTADRLFYISDKIESDFCANSNIVQLIVQSQFTTVQGNTFSMFSRMLPTSSNESSVIHDGQVFGRTQLLMWLLAAQTTSERKACVLLRTRRIRPSIRSTRKWFYSHIRTDKLVQYALIVQVVVVWLFAKGVDIRILHSHLLDNSAIVGLLTIDVIQATCQIVCIVHNNAIENNPV